jgi:hypothetical protein
MNDISVTSNISSSYVRRARLAGALAGLILVAGALTSHGGNIGGSACKPVLALKDVKLSAITAQQREWTATLAVDHSSCTSPSGSFKLGFIRVKENAPDLEFVEQVTWELQPKQISASFWEDEAPASFWIDDVAPCACRR